MVHTCSITVRLWFKVMAVVFYFKVKCEKLHEKNNLLLIFGELQQTIIWLLGNCQNTVKRSYSKSRFSFLMSLEFNICL